MFEKYWFKIRNHDFLDKELLNGLVWFGGFYGISTFVGYLTPNQFSM